MLELKQLSNQLTTLMISSKQHVTLILELIAGLWIFNFINWITGSVLNVLGTIPRSKRGLLGIIFSWSLHGNFNHLFFNSIPLFTLSLLLISFDPEMFYNATILIMVLEGSSVWLFARHGNHIGASGLVAGYFGFALIFAYKSATIVGVLLGFIVLYYFGGILLSFFPTEAKTSWEAHLFGFLSGVASFFIIFDYEFMPLNYLSLLGS
ncbi:MAG: rhomboid family intramembrane serine protease [Gammaproteobacteria bacterium]